MIYPVIMCGGYGTRLWPLSRTNLPKQFIKAFAGRSLFQNTLGRISNPKHFHAPYIVTNIEQKYLVKEQLEEEAVPHAKIYLEPEPHSTAPAITVAALDILKHDPNAVMLALSSDSEIKKPKTFVRILNEAAKVAIKHKKFLLFSSKPTYTETGYGYIRSGEILNEPKDGVHVHEISHFIEKPSFSEAESCIKSGYQWNSGIFLLPVKQFLEELEMFAPEIHRTCKTTIKASSEQRENGYSLINLDKENFANCPVDSIDYAVMEKTKNSAVVKTNIGWYDVGSWQTFYEVTPKDSDGNILSGNIISINSKDSHIYSTDKTRILAAIDIHNLTIVQTTDATLVIPRERSQDVKKIISILKERESTDFLQDTKTYFNWGSSEIIRKETLFKLKKIIIKPKHKMPAAGNSKAKHFIVTKGKAYFKFGTTKLTLNRNESLMLEHGIKYSISNRTTKGLEIVKMESKDISLLTTKQNNI
jgi:mannose-1-phosphate guanylyltransferase/mannose-6-phosphate isomerase